MNETIVDAEVVEMPEVEVGTAVAVAPAGNLFATDPVESLEKAKEVASALTDVLRGGGMIANIQRKEYVNVEGWQTLGSMVGVSGVVTHTENIGNGWMATAEARTMDGRVIGRADAICSRDESTWNSRPDYALLGMAQTRAISRALRGPLGFVVKLAGFEATAAEEIPHDGDSLGGGSRPEDNLQMGVLPEGAPFSATVRDASWVNAKGKDKIVLIAGVANTNPNKQDAGEKLWLEPGRPDYKQFVEHICGGIEPPVGGSLAALVGKPFDLTVSLNGQYRNFAISAPTPVEVAA
ncbi:MAG: hypothetical protein KGZ65_06190 [Sphingomonadales bacterium]|nr:hypothetical protein [Sphingomonadaceae bacterium]MBS3930809.1 hypothetical protein [Sphingomonadales bacterium]